MSDLVVIVDDDANLIAGLRRQLRRRYNLVTAQGGEEAIALLEAQGSIGVVVCDMRMPGMDGLQVLKEFRQRSPETVRLMLTGNADQQTAIEAINQGAIFRFLSKPTAIEDLCAGIDAALDQYHLVTAERDLLEKTLAGSVKVLTGVLALNDPDSYSRALRMRDWLRRIGKTLALRQRWQLEMAVMLAPLGMVAVPPEVLANLHAGVPLSPAEKAILQRTPEAARDLIINIPRLKTVAETVYLQDKNHDGSGFPEDDTRSGNDLPFDARLIHILNDLSRDCSGSHPTAETFNRLSRRAHCYDPRLLAGIREVLLGPGQTPDEEQPTTIFEQLPVLLLLPGHFLHSDIRLENGHLVLAKGVELTEAQVVRLRNLTRLHQFREPIQISRPL